MYKRLRLRLTLVCALGTLLVLAGMSVLSLGFSLRQLTRQNDASFRGSVSSVLFYLQGTGTVDHTWLAQTEAENDLVIRLEYDGTTLDYTALDPWKQGVGTAALETAQSLYPAFWQAGAASLGATTELYAFSGELGGFRAAACLLPREGSLYTVVISQSMEEENATRRELYLFYGLGTLAAAVALSAFAWFFSKRAMAPAVEADRKQKEFISAASHELRSPLAVIRLSAGSIKTLPEDAPVLADKIENECERMGRLIGDLLLLSGGAAGMGVQKGATSPQTVLLTTFERFEGIASQKAVSLTPFLPETHLPKANWDAARVEQALAVLLDNAISYTPAGGRIQISLVCTGGMAVYRVEDSGPGISPAEREKVFDRFYRADAARSKKEHYGLGLSVAREIARLHCGTLTAGASQALGGAAFCLSLPL